MIKQLVLIGMIVILVTVDLSGCEDFNKNINSEKNKFIGTWQTKTSNNTTVYNNTLLFYTNGTLLFRNLTGRWSLEDGKLAMDITTAKGTIHFIYRYIFSDTDKALKLTNSMDGTTAIWIKQ